MLYDGVLLSPAIGMLGFDHISVELRLLTGTFFIPQMIYE
jgi:hypothetical protein